MEKQNYIEWEADKKRLIKELKSESLSDREREQKVSHLKTIESILNSVQEMEEQTKEMEEMERQIAQHFVKSWKINKALYEKYGGRVICFNKQDLSQMRRRISRLLERTREERGVPDSR